MAKRYFMAEIGKLVIFRGSESRVYASARLRGSFSSNPARPGWVPAVEISKAHYEALQAAKAARCRAQWEAKVAELGREVAEKHWRYLQPQYRNTPEDSWVSLEAARAALATVKA